MATRPVFPSIISVNLSMRVAVVGPAGDDLAAHRIDRADVVDHAVGEVHRELLASGKDVFDALVRGRRGR